MAQQSPQQSSLQDSLTTDGRARLLIEAIKDYAIYMLDPQGVITSWNAGAQRFKGYTADEVLGTSFSRFYVEADRKAGVPDRALATAAAEGKFEAEGWRVRKDGTTFWAHVVIDPIRSADGRILGFAKVTQDLTERRQSQLALEETRAELIQSQKMDAIGQLTGGVAHDFNNLLMAISSSLELLKKRIDGDARATRLLENATLAARRGISLTQRMLAFARRQDLKAQSIDPSTLVRGVLELLQRSLGPSITIDTDLSHEVEPVVVDSNQLEMAILNLALNSRDAMPAGGALKISVRREVVVAAPNPSGLPPGAYVCIAISDEGEGMDEATLARSVEPFFTTKGTGKGTGLGLSMVHGLAAQFGGKLAMHSSSGKGTTAEIWLPASAEAVVQADPGVTASEIPAMSGKILAVDDDPIVLMNTSFLLEDLGYKVLSASSGKQALALLNAGEQIGLVIADQAMPGMTGTELIRAIHERWPAMPIVLATGYGEVPADVVIDTKLTKPYGQAELQSAVGFAMASARRPERVAST